MQPLFLVLQRHWLCFGSLVATRPHTLLTFWSPLHSSTYTWQSFRSWPKQTSPSASTFAMCCAGNSEDTDSCTTIYGLLCSGNYGSQLCWNSVFGMFPGHRKFPQVRCMSLTWSLLALINPTTVPTSILPPASFPPEPRASLVLSRATLKMTTERHSELKISNVAPTWHSVLTFS